MVSGEFLFSPIFLYTGLTGDSKSKGLPYLSGKPFVMIIPLNLFAPPPKRESSEFSVLSSLPRRLEACGLQLYFVFQLYSVAAAA